MTGTFFQSLDVEIPFQIFNQNFCALRARKKIKYKKNTTSPIASLNNKKNEGLVWS